MSTKAPLVRKSNMLARAHWGPGSLWEPRIVALLASKISWDDKDFQVYRIHVSELFGPKYGGKDFSDLETAVERAMSRVLTIRDDKGWTKYNLFSKCRFIRADGILELGFHPDLKPHYLQLKQYVRYSLTDFLQLPSVYSQRIFEILKSWADRPEIVLPLTELHDMLETPPSMRKDFRQFRLRVLEKAKADIIFYTNFKFDWEPIKKGRAVTDIHFVFSRKRIAEVEIKRQEQLSEIRKNNFLSYVRCFKIRGGECEGGHQPDDVCEICRHLRQ